MLLLSPLHFICVKSALNPPMISFQSGKEVALATHILIQSTDFVQIFLNGQLTQIA